VLSLWHHYPFAGAGRPPGLRFTVSWCYRTAEGVEGLGGAFRKVLGHVPFLPSEEGLGALTPLGCTVTSGKAVPRWNRSSEGRKRVVASARRHFAGFEPDS